MRHPILAGSLLVTALAAGCASTPEAPHELDTAAKRYETNDAAATIYVYRDQWDNGEADSVLYVDQRLIGSTLPATYFRFYVRAGVHELHGFGGDNGSLRIETRTGAIYFVSLQVRNGSSSFALEKPASAKHRIAECCDLLENWAPGQRPLLR